MKLAFCSAPMAHFSVLMSALARGVDSCGDIVEPIPTSTARLKLDRSFDAAVCWGWRRGLAIRTANPTLPVLVMERGYVGDRFHWTSLGWNGLNGRAVFPPFPLDADGATIMRRWTESGHDAYWQPWYKQDVRDPHSMGYEKSGYALILGQVPSDMACRDISLAYHYRKWESELLSAGYDVKFRPHPQTRGREIGISRRRHTSGTLAQDLAGAKFTVSWNSNASVDSVLAGVPSVTLDEGSMAWAVTSHKLSHPVTMPRRTEWAAQLAWCQWQPSELTDGSAWRAVKMVMPR